MVKINSNGVFCEFRSDVDSLKWNEVNLPSWDRFTFNIGDTILCFEDFSIWFAAIGGDWKEAV